MELNFKRDFEWEGGEGSSFDEKADSFITY